MAARRSGERLRGGVAARRTGSGCGGRAKECSGRWWSGVEQREEENAEKRERRKKREEKLRK
ncbi:hypothetical protein DEO72_LG4g1356 [Vigna unguiculata]|uniref:Uncharacterized protein n=1 Tax=Vigna unguiculata TaxID=3917 RepID=A0A4D6LPD2_VIGUN|nr:hypothetical protein DEO72_LG4g1356 [Vigna unguiculata]